LKLPILVLGVFAVARGELGVRGLATELVLALLAPRLLLATGVAALVERVARDTWGARTAGIGKNGSARV
jgi:hypothetical protein